MQIASPPRPPEALIPATSETLFVSRSENDTNGAGRALAEIDEALHRWASAARDPRDHSAWERQITRLREAGYGDHADELTKSAAQHARWNTEPTRA